MMHAEGYPTNERSLTSFLELALLAVAASTFIACCHRQVLKVAHSALAGGCASSRASSSVFAPIEAPMTVCKQQSLKRV